MFGFHDQSTQKPKMIFHLVFFLGLIAISTAIKTDIDQNPKVVINSSGTLVSLNEASTHVDLSDQNIQSIDTDAFANSSQIISLNLSKNLIKHLPENVFSHLTNLENLSLANNQIEDLPTKNVFIGLDRLKSLNISNNPLKKILDENNFFGLPKFCEIYISGSTNFSALTPLAFGKKPNNSSVIEIDDRRISTNTCNKIINPDIRESLEKIESQIDSNVLIKICIDDKKMKSVELLNINETLPTNCKSFSPTLEVPKLKFFEMRIESFEKGWYQIENISFSTILLINNRITEVTSNLMNDLPETIKYVSLEHNLLTRLNKGVIVNEYLRGLDLSNNGISEIEEDALIGTNLTLLDLGNNLLRQTNFALNLPKSLIKLNLESNGINQIASGSFSNLKELQHLDMSYNNILELESQSLSGLISLQNFHLKMNNLKMIQSGVFQNLGNLSYLDIESNNIENLDKGAFNGLECLTSLNLGFNNLKRFTKDMLNGLTNNCEIINLISNELETLETDTFVNVPKFELHLGANNINKIEKGTFDLPYLTYLQLDFNNISIIESGAAKNLGKLAEKINIQLGGNPIKRLNVSTLSGVSNEARVYLNVTPIEVIQAGVFDDM